jgi:ubiquinone biosynthesis protein
MLNTSWIPTPLVPPDQRPPVPLLAVVKPSRFRSALVVWQFVLLAAALAGLLVRRSDPDRYARRVRETFERLGGLWIKAGQVIALRIDLLPESLCRELSRLQSRALGFPGEVSEQIIEQDLGVPLDTLFDHWDRTPVAAASIGQVHRARLREEQAWVAVKIQKPYSAELFARDLVVIEWLVWLVNALRIYPHMKWTDGLEEIRTIMREELDFQFEASSTRRMRKMLKDHRVYVPKVYSRYCSERVLVLEFVEMVLMADYLRIAKEDPVRLSQWRADNNVTAAKVARRLVYSFQRQMIHENSYHGDMHPGNIGLLRGSRIALIDFGSNNFTESEYLWRFRLLMRSLATGEFAKGADMCLMLCASLPPIDLALVHTKLMNVMHSWAKRTLVPELPFHDKSLGNLTTLIMMVLLGYRCTMEWAWLRMHRAGATLDASLIELAPGIDYRKITARVFARAEARRIAGLVSRVGVRRSLGAAVEALQQPARLEEYVFTQAGLIRRQVQVFRSFTDAAGAALTTMVNLGKVVVLAQAAILLAMGFGALVMAPMVAFGSMVSPGAFALDPRPLAVFLLLDVWLWMALTRLRDAIGDGRTQLHRQAAA